MEPDPQGWQLQAGALSAVLEGAFLRYIRAGDQEVARGVYMAFRDRNWNTVLPHFLDYHVDRQPDSFVVHFTPSMGPTTWISPGEAR